MNLQALTTELVTVGSQASDGTGTSEVHVSSLFQDAARVLGVLRMHQGRLWVYCNGDPIDRVETLLSAPAATTPTAEAPTRPPLDVLWEDTTGPTFKIPPGCPSCQQLGVWPDDSVPAHVYLQGDVRAKLRAAEAAGFTENAEALRAVLPQPLRADDLYLSPGAAWLPPEVIKDWALSLFPAVKWGIAVERLEGAGAWSIGCTNPQVEREGAAVRVADLSTLDVIRYCVDGRMPAVWRAGNYERRSRDQAGTVQAQARVQELRAGFGQWVRSDPVRLGELTARYESSMRGYSPAAERGDLDFPGMRTAGYSLFPYQLRGVWRILLGGTLDRSALLPYAPGRGKTDPAIAAAVKLWQMGGVGRTIIAVPSSVVGQWCERFRWLYPALRGELQVVRSVGELSAHLPPFLLMSHETLERVLVEPAAVEREYSERAREVRECLREAEHGGRQEGVRSARSVLRSRERQLDRAVEEHAELWKVRMGPSWSELGCSHLVFDEFHAFKRLGFATRMENVRGLSTGESQRAASALLKCREVHRSGGRVTALTGTPLTNTLAEAWVWMTFLQPNLLRHHGLQHFDAWASVFAEPFSSVELDAVGFQTVTRLRFRNVPNLLAMLGECWDFVGAREAEEHLVAMSGASDGASGAERSAEEFK